MPNGHVHYDSSDILHWRHTEQGYPPLFVDRFDYSRGVRMLSLRGVRGYAPEPDMTTLKFWPPPPRGAQRADIDRFAEQCVAAIQALLVSNPSDPLDPSVRFADLAWVSFEAGWALAVGYHLYVRERGGALRLAIDPTPALGDIDEAHRAEAAKFFARMLTSIGVAGPTMPATTAASYVVDLRGSDELICTSTPLHAVDCWPELATLPVFDARATGLLVEAMRAYGVEHEQDQVALRGLRPAT